MAVAPKSFESEFQKTDYLAAVPDIYTPPQHDLSDVIALGGLGTAHGQLWLYKPLLENEQSPLPAKDRFLPPLGRGLVDVEEMIGQMEEDIETVVERLEEPVSVFAHSLGEHLGMAVAVKRPDLFKSFVGAGGVGFGIESLTPVAGALKALLKKAKGTEDIMRDSPYMQEHIHRVTTEWSPDVPMHLIATPYDELAKFSDTLGIELPPGQSIEKRVIVQSIPILGWRIPGIGELLQGTMDMPPDARLIHSPLPALHAFLPLHPEVIKYDRQVRSSLLEQSAATPVADIRSARPKLQLSIA
jgi:pimeloyl-ACP methyl ester carboxylesterase